MKDLNVLTISGRLGADPSLTVTQNQKNICNFTLAVTTGYGDFEKTNWIKFTAFGKLAEFIANNCGKGDKCVVKGTLTFDEWENKDGSKSRRENVLVEDFMICQSMQSKEKSSQPAKPKSNSENKSKKPTQQEFESYEIDESEFESDFDYDGAVPF